MNAIPKFKGVRVVFADGTELVVPPLNLAAVEMLQERLVAFSGGLDAHSVALVADATVLALQRNYPGISREQVVSELLDLGNMAEVMEAVMDVSGFKRKQQEAAAAPGGAPGEAPAGMANR
ncbi:MAG: hypothetical protein ACOYBN_09605 [Limnohabitans sp.]